METVAIRPSFLPSPKLLAAAPHRLLFCIGAANVMLAMLWWTLWLVDQRWRLFALSAPPVPAGWGHAVVMSYQVLTPFIFGFLLTVFPRWLGQPPLPRSRYLPVGLGLFGGQLVMLLGLLGQAPLVWTGLLMSAAGWGFGVAVLARVLWRSGRADWHAISCLAALVFGLFGLALFLGFLAGLDPRMAFAALKIGALALLLPIYFTVCHRMIPFFTGCVVPNYQPYRALWTLAAFWPLLLAHLLLELRHAYEWLWLPDLALAALGAWLLWRWHPRAKMPALLRVLYLGFAWLPIAFALYAAQSAWHAWDGAFVLGRAPVHALTIGFFGSLLVAMVTRVTQGHSGRPLQLGRVAAFAFVCIQLVAVTRIAADALPDGAAWQALAGLGWLVAFLPWVLRSGWIYLTPRADGQPG